MPRPRDTPSSGPQQACCDKMPQPPGLHRITTDQREALVATAADAGLELVTIDLRTCTTKTDALQRIADALNFPPWFGHNWDALSDCLADLSWLPGSGHVLLLEHTDRLRSAAPEDLATAAEILDEACQDRNHHGLPTWAYLISDGAVPGVRKP